MPDADDTTSTDTAPPLGEATAALAAQGFSVEGGYPANFRLRAEVLVAEGKATDPTGMIGDDLIADTAERLKVEQGEADEAAAAEAKEVARIKAMTRDQLADLATEMELPVASDANKPTLLEAILAARAANEG